MVSQFMHSPKQTHLDVVICIQRYLKLAPEKGLFFGNHGHTQVEAFIDIDWACLVTDRRLATRYCSFIGGNLVTWRSKKQHMEARSSAEVEFKAMAQGVCELL